MNNTERVGLSIVVTVFILLAATFVYTEIRALPALVDAGRFDWLEVGKWLVGVLVISFLFGVAGYALWRGHQAVRWFIFSFGVIFAAGIISVAIWMTTLDYPNAKTPEIRAEMQADDRRQLPWRILQGAGPMAVGALLFLPPVSRFLKHRRTVSAEPVPPGQSAPT